MSGDRRLIEDFLPIEAINVVAQREKIGHARTHPRKLHLWWARRPLAAARAAVYSALVPAEGRGRTPAEEATFFDALCRWGGPPAAIAQARAEVLAANGGVPPKVLDPFAGGGAIPLEAARLGCEVTAGELNPVAHLIERCMLEYPQKFPGLGDDVRRWGKVWVDRAWSELADLYPPVGPGSGQQRFSATEGAGRRPLAYLWTRTVRCPNPALAEHRVPLVRQTWLARKKGRNIAMRMVADRDALTVRYEVVESATREGLGFDPAAHSRRGQTTCPVCGATVDSAYVKAEGMAGRMGVAPVAAVLLKTSGRGRDYLAPGSYPLPDDEVIFDRIKALGLDPPSEKLPENETRAAWCTIYGLARFRDLFTPRQLCALLTMAAGVEQVHQEMLGDLGRERAEAVATCIGVTLSRITARSSALCYWDLTNESILSTFARQALPMVWDFAEVLPFLGGAVDASKYIEDTAAILDDVGIQSATVVLRSSATQLPLHDDSQDAVITDPPYYDNIWYADLSDFFYVWLKRSIGFLHPDHLGGEVTPKRNEIVMAPYRFGGDTGAARDFYESMMAQAFAEAHRVLKPGAPLVCIFAHKTTLGWSTLVDALRTAGFTITEAWPLDTEMTTALKSGVAALASSIFLVARKRNANAGVGNESEVMTELLGIVDERLRHLAAAGVSGSDLIIATVGAGLRAFTRHEYVEQDNGESLPSERFLAIVQNKVLDAIFGGLAGVDATTRFYVAAQFSYGYVAVPFGEANNLANMSGVELDGPYGLTAGANPLVAKSGSTMTLRDFEARGDDPRLGLSDESDLLDRPVPLVDVAQAVLWRADHRPAGLKDFLALVHPNPGRLRTVVQALAGKALREGNGDAKAAEAVAAERLLGSWRRLVEENLFS